VTEQFCLATNPSLGVWKLTLVAVTVSFGHWFTGNGEKPDDNFTLSYLVSKNCALLGYFAAISDSFLPLLAA